MISPRVTRALNPHRKRKLTLKQIRAGFGGKRRLASLKASNRHKHKRRATAANPKKRKRRATAKAKNATRARTVYRTRTKVKYRTKKVYVKSKPRRKANAKRRRRSSRSSNPPYLMTLKPLGAAAGNPHRKRRKSVAKHRRKASAKGRSSAKRRNPTRRRSVARRGRRRMQHRSRNPMDSSLLKKGFGVFLGFSGVKKLSPMLGATMNASPTMSLLSAGITAFVLAWGTKKFMPGVLAEGVMWGAVGGVVNQAWNSFAPAGVTGIWPGVGDFAPGGFPLPQGPVRYITAPSGMTPTGSQVNVGAFGAAW